MIELRPCPFCGGEAEFGAPELFTPDENGSAAPGIFCHNECGGAVIIPLTGQETRGNSPHDLRMLAAATWNRRAGA